MQESCSSSSYFNVCSLMGEAGVKINLHTVLTKLLLPSPLLHFGAQAAPPSASRSRPKALALSAQVSLGSGPDGWETSGPRLGWGQWAESRPGLRNPRFLPWKRPHIKANLRGASPQDKWKIKEGEVSTGHRERQPAGDHSEEAPTQPWQLPSWGARGRKGSRPASGAREGVP